MPLSNNPFPQIMTTIPVCFTALIRGMLLGWTSPEIVEMAATSLETFVLTISFFAGNIFSGIILIIFRLKNCSRRNGIIASMIIMTIAALWLSVVSYDVEVFGARFLGGVGSGLCYIFLPIYLSEIASPELRNIFGLLPKFYTYIGFSIGCSFVNDRLQALVITVITIVIAFPMLCLIPESPIYLLYQNEIDSLEVLKLLNRPEGFDYKLFDELKLKLYRDSEILPNFKNFLVEPQNLASIGIVLIISLIEINSGFYIFVQYCYLIVYHYYGTEEYRENCTGLIPTDPTITVNDYGDIITTGKYTRNKISEYHRRFEFKYQKIINEDSQDFDLRICVTTLIIGSFIGVCVINRWGKSFLFGISCLISGISSLIIGFYLLATRDGYCMDSFYFLVMFVTVAYFGSQGLGLNQMMFTYIELLFPSNSMILASSYLNIIYYTFILLTDVYTRELAYNYGLGSLFLIYAFVSFFGVAFAWRVLFITKDITNFCGSNRLRNENQNNWDYRREIVPPAKRYQETKSREVKEETTSMDSILLGETNKQ